MADEKKTSAAKKRRTTKKPEAEPQAPSAEIATTGIDATPDENERAVVMVADLNRETFGELLLHFPERDVSIVLDGSTAARVIAAFAEPRRRALLQDQIDVSGSPMTNLWSSFNLARLLGVSWIPGLASRAAERMTVDPPVPTTAGL